MWDADRYRRFEGERARPFSDLLARVHAADPWFVADLGCGPGNMTELLAKRWPKAQVLGVDNSREMVDAARARQAASGDRLAFARGDVRNWKPDRPVDVLTCNAVLQWVPGHATLLTNWVARLAPGGWLAVQVPGNADQPSDQILRDLTVSSQWRSVLAGVELNDQEADPVFYLDLLTRAGCTVDAWETTYLHVLPSPDSVVEWYKGTGLRPVLAALPPALADQFIAEYTTRIRSAYPVACYGTVLPFRRVFAVAHR